ncbi:MAG TPA: MBL fold metallo-hydrolase [Anaeromyxobacter sp.]|nr:MBL fold metallo-hydrolase [Anaeromyxobacter sp.]
MSEPKSRARKIETVLPGVFHWSVNDDRIGFRGDAWAVKGEGAVVWIDPHPLQAPALEKLDAPTDIVLTIQSHQRAAWRYRRRFGAKVHAPKGAQGLEEEPDHWYGEGDRLPAGLRAVHAPGPCDASCALLLERPDGLVAFTGDLVVEDDEGRLTFVADAYQDEPRRTRDSVRKLAGERIEVVCPGHGPPILSNGAQALAAVLDREAGS